MADKTALDATRAIYAKAAQDLTVALTRVIDAKVRTAYPQATELVVHGYRNEDWCDVIRVKAVLHEGTVLADFEDLYTTEFDKLSDEIDPLLDEVGELTGDDYMGEGRRYTLHTADEEPAAERTGDVRLEVAPYVDGWLVRRVVGSEKLYITPNMKKAEAVAEALRRLCSNSGPLTDAVIRYLNPNDPIVVFVSDHDDTTTADIQAVMDGEQLHADLTGLDPRGDEVIVRFVLATEEG